jgi:ribosomal protein S18 acetylase RimI-like enzyme
MEIQIAKESQLLEVLYIIRECSQHSIDKGKKSTNSSYSDYSEISRDIVNNYVYITFLNLVPVGTITLKPCKDNDAVMHIERLSIFPHFQRRGLAKSMIDFAEKHARSIGYTKLRGAIPVNDDSVCKLFEEKGFKNLGILQQIPYEISQVTYEKSLS